MTVAGKDMVAELEDLSESLEANKQVMATEMEGHNAKQLPALALLKAGNKWSELDHFLGIDVEDV